MPSDAIGGPNGPERHDVRQNALGGLLGALLGLMGRSRPVSGG